MKSKLLCVLLIVGLFKLNSCKKDNEDLQPENPPVATSGTKFKFFLYTTQDFSEYPGLINFRMHIRNNNNIIVDSSLITMRIKDIPNEANKLVFERRVANGQQGFYKAGFIYSIENVGMSWHFETCEAGIEEKTIDFNFK